VKKPTLRDVSKATGLSTYTVSRALSNGDGVSAATREIVLQAARDAGYVTNRAAQQLRKNTRSSVAVITASTSNYYYIDLMKGIERTLRECDRTAIVADIAAEGVYTAELENLTVQNLVQTRPAGVIATLTLSADNVKLLHDWDIPIVFVDSSPPDFAIPVPSITTDNFAASMNVGEHLADHGYRDWLFLAYPARWSTRAERERGMREAARLAKATLVVIECENDLNSASSALASYIDNPRNAMPRAIVAGNNPLLHGALHALQDRGVRIPEQTAVIAFDEFAWAPLLNPPLTVLDENSEAIGVLAAQTLTRVIDRQIDAERRGDSPTPVYEPGDRRQLTSQLIIRRSCGC
jgi:LacI family transcriptional regulator